MKLTDLEAAFIRAKPAGEPHGHREVASIDEATGVTFLCPKCMAASLDGRRGVHGVICWSENRGTPADYQPGPGRWALVGTSLDDLTLDGENGRTRSVLLLGGCNWHGYITNGDVSTAA